VAAAAVGPGEGSIGSARLARLPKKAPRGPQEHAAALSEINEPTCITVLSPTQLALQVSGRSGAPSPNAPPRKAPARLLQPRRALRGGMHPAVGGAPSGRGQCLVLQPPAAGYPAARLWLAAPGLWLLVGLLTSCFPPQPATQTTNTPLTSYLLPFLPRPSWTDGHDAHLACQPGRAGAAASSHA